MGAKEWEDPVLDGLIEAYLILEKENDKDLKRNNEIIRKLREHEIKLDYLGERVETGEGSSNSNEN